MAGREIAGSDPMRGLIEGWERWRGQIPPEERERVAQIIAESDFHTKSGLNLMIGNLLVALLKGSISPVVMIAARPWVDLLIYNIDSQHQQQGTPQQTGTSLMMLMADLTNRLQPLQPVYQVAQLATPEAPSTPDVIEMPAPQVMKAK